MARVPLWTGSDVSVIYDYDGALHTCTLHGTQPVLDNQATKLQNLNIFSRNPKACV